MFQVETIPQKTPCILLLLLILAGPTVTRLVQDPLSVTQPENRLYLGVSSYADATQKVIAIFIVLRGCGLEH